MKDLSEPEHERPSTFHTAVHALGRPEKRVILAVADFCLFVFALWAAYALRIGFPSLGLVESLIPLFVIAAASGVIVNWVLGFYKTLIRAFELRTGSILAGSVFINGLLLATFAYLSSAFFVPRSVPIIFMLVAFLAIAASRAVARWYYRYSLNLHLQKTNVAIYGAGEAGNQVASFLSNSSEMSLVGFIDDDKSLQGHTMRGRKIYVPEQVDRLIERYGKVKVLLSIADLTPMQKRSIFSKLEPYNVEIDVIPSLVDVVSGKETLENIRDLRIEDLLGRETVPPIEEFFRDAIEGKTILVTGAGGSIGSEICRQIVANGAANLIAIDQSELGIYQLERDLIEHGQLQDQTTNMTFLLCDVHDREKIAHLMKAHEPQVVYHAAAYKHVPIVENNIVESLKNNVLGTRTVASESLKAGVERFILVSTDKAVRPTNVMGATKRTAELVVQSLADKSDTTVFSMVRFGNVLGSSGSVIPLFQSQIEKGGPVTVTHKDVTRYFMTIPEAAQLVIQAGFLAKGGDVFVLDMGEPVKIRELAKLVIRLSGYSYFDEFEGNGDIEIKYVGLRPGEKLFEELLIDPNASGTTHPKIMVASEKFLTAAKLNTKLEAIEKSIHSNNPDAALKVLSEIVDGFER